MKVIITIDQEPYRLILEYLHYQLPEEYTRQLSDFGIVPQLMIYHPEFKYLDLQFNLVENEIFQKSHMFRKYSQLEISGNRDSIKSFISVAMETMRKNKYQQEFLVIYKSNYNNFTEDTKLNHRSIDTVYLPKQIKDDLFKDIFEFYNPENIIKYTNLGINRTRMYMLHGMPGTGKTTLIKAIATHYNKNIAYIFIKHDMDYDNFHKLIKNLPSNTIICFEDVDCLFDEARAQKTALTFSGFINVFDGINTNQEIIVFFTTNNLKIIDPAIIRRISYFIEFKFATKEQIKDMFGTFFPNYLPQFEEFYKNIITNTTINIMEKFFVKYLFDDIIEKSKLFSKFANGELCIKQGASNLYI